MVNFQSFALNAADHTLCAITAELINVQWPHIPNAARLFIDDLLTGKQQPMGYLFFQEFTEKGILYEGVVVSYGRINQDNRRFRDRLDVILQSPVNAGVSAGLSRLRIYVDPYNNSQKKQPLWQALAENSDTPLAQQLFAYTANLSWQWANDKNRVWKHWVTEYIDYFGPRQWVMQKSFFHVANRCAHRVDRT